MLALAHYADLTNQLTDDPQRSTQEMLVAARRSVELGTNDGLAYAALALSLSATGQQEKMRAAGDQIKG